MKIDLVKVIPSFHAKAGRLDIVDVPPLRYLAVDAEGNPNTSDDFREAIEAIYPMAYALKFGSKVVLDRDYVVPPMEALWWADDMAAFTEAKKDQWHSTVLIMLPDWITDEAVAVARKKAGAKVPPEQLGRVYVAHLHEGVCAQTLYVGPYADEAPTIEALHKLIEERGMVRSGKHHEIYLGDARRTAPEKLRTIIRQPARPA